MKKSLILAAIFILGSLSSVWAKDMRFIQVTDTMYNSLDESSVEKLQTLVSEINKEPSAEFVIFTGNNITKPTIDNLEGFIKETNNLKIPYYVVLGNKDVNKQRGVGKKEYVSFLKKNVKSHKKIESPNFVFEKNGIVFIVADGSKEVIPSSMGYYKADVLKWLDEQLTFYKDKNIVIFQHFPLIPPAERESHYTFKADEYLKLLTKHPNVKAIFAGHFGVNNEQVVNGILHVATRNAPYYRVIDMTDYETQNPTFWSVIKEGTE